jgi:hypothetical protein
MRVLTYALVALGVLATKSACYAASQYDGDGKLVDYGSHRLTKRYELVLGTVELGRTQELHFRMAKLPLREFVAGIRLDPRTCSAMKSNSLVAIAITNEKGDVVIREERPLNEFTWETGLGSECKSPFGYIRGRSKETPVGNGDVCNQPVITGADSGRGSYFSPRTGGSYAVTIRVSPGSLELPSNSTAQVVLQDNGAPTARQTRCP